VITKFLIVNPKWPKIATMAAHDGGRWGYQNA
jgi:hypothetical protein